MKRLGFIVVFIVAAHSAFGQSARDTIPNYWNKAWRDSVAEYQGRVTAYHQELYSYDWAMLFSFLPVAGNGIYMDDYKTGALYFGTRLGFVALGTVGTVRLTRGSGNQYVNAGMIVAGVVGYLYFKWSEISEMQHETSYRNEALVEKFRIAESDITPGSIRYPTKQWPDWVTARPAPRDPQDARKAVDTPIPSFNGAQVTQIRFEVGF